MRNNNCICLTIFVFLFRPFRGYEEGGFNNDSTTSVQHPQSPLQDIGKQIHDILNSVEPVKDNSIIYFDLYDVVHKYLASRMDKISSSYDVELHLYDLFESGNVNQIRRRVNTVIECADENEILGRIPSTLRKRAEALLFKRYSTYSGECSSRKTIKGSIDILCINKHDVQFAIKTNFLNVGQNYSTKRLTGDCLLGMPLWCESAVENNAVKTMLPSETIYIGVVCDVAKGRLCMGFYNPSSDHEPSYVST